MRLELKNQLDTNGEGRNVFTTRVELSDYELAALALFSDSANIADFDLPDNVQRELEEVN